MAITRGLLKGEKIAKESNPIRILFISLCLVSSITLIMNWYGNVSINDKPDKFYATMSPYFAWLGIVCLIIGQFLLANLFVKKIDFKIRTRKNKRRYDLLSLEEKIQDYVHDKAVLLAEKERKIDKYILEQNKHYKRFFDFIDEAIEQVKKQEK